MASRKSPPVKKTSRKKQGKKVSNLATIKALPYLGLDRLGYLVLALGVVAAGLFSLRNYNMLLPEGNPFGNLPTTWLLVLGVAALVFLWRLVPKAPEDGADLPAIPARTVFWLLMIAGFLLRMDHAERSMGWFWDDHYIVITDIRNIIDYREHPLLFPSGWREPLFPYFTAFLWVLLPKATGIYIVNLSSALLDLFIFWVSYLLGKGIGGRRMGLILMGMEVISKPMIQMCKVGFGNDTSILGCALAALFFLRVLKKPDLKHFIEFGLALGFGALCYVPYRPWTPAMLGAVWLWVLWDPKERKWDAARWIIGPGILAAWAVLFVYKNGLIADDGSLAKVLTSPFLLGAVGLAILFGWSKAGLREYKNSKKGKGISRLFSWATAALVTLLVMSPFLLHPHYSTHTSDISVFSKYYAHSREEGFRNLWNNVFFVQYLMFGQTNDVARIPILGDSFFDFYTALFGLLGLAYFTARPSWTKAYVVALYLLSQTTAILANAPHSLRFAAIVLPLLWVGAWGANRLWLAFEQTFSPRSGTLLFSVLLVAFGAWEAERNMWITHRWVEQRSPDLTINDVASQELADHRVYLVHHHPGFYTSSQDVLCEYKDIFRVNASNEIDLTPGQTGKDLAILVSGEDLNSQKMVEKAFPGHPWKGQMCYWQGSQEIPFVRYMEIPFAEVPEGDQGLFHVRHVSANSWRRRCYGRYGIGKGLILYEDRVKLWNETAPPPDAVDWNNSMRVEGDWNVTTPGSYTFTVHTANVLWFIVDGKKEMEVLPREGLVERSCQLDLKAGNHHVEVVTAFTWEHKVPVVTVSGAAVQGEVPLDEFAARSAQP